MNGEHDVATSITVCSVCSAC